MINEEFKQELVERLKELLPPEYDNARFQFNIVAKANDEIKTGLSIMKPGENLCPHLYIDELYTDYITGQKDIDFIARQLCEARIRNDRPSVAFPIEEIMEFDNVKDHIFPRLCDPDTNTERLRELAYSLEDNLAATYYISLSEEASAPVTNSMLEVWGMELMDVREAALENMKGQAVMNTLEDKMTALMFDSAFEPENLLERPGNITGYTDLNFFMVSNKSCNLGAAVMMMDELKEQIAEKMGGDYYVLPSSVHEQLIIPASPGVDPEMLVEMVHSVNETEVSREDFLSDKVQAYDSQAKQMMLVEDYAPAKDMMPKENGKGLTS